MNDGYGKEGLKEKWLRYDRLLASTHSSNSPYDITLSEVGFIFLTDNGIHYRVSFDEEDMIVCDTSDGKEGGRNRLFLRWFERHASSERFTICTANAKVEDETVYISEMGFSWFYFFKSNHRNSIVQLPCNYRVTIV